MKKFHVSMGSVSKTNVPVIPAGLEKHVMSMVSADYLKLLDIIISTQARKKHDSSSTRP
jgi:hypothetical protein